MRRITYKDFITKIPGTIKLLLLAIICGSAISIIMKPLLKDVKEELLHESTEVGSQALKILRSEKINLTKPDFTFETKSFKRVRGNDANYEDYLAGRYEFKVTIANQVRSIRVEWHQEKRTFPITIQKIELLTDDLWSTIFTL